MLSDNLCNKNVLLRLHYARQYACRYDKGVIACTEACDQDYL